MTHAERFRHDPTWREGWPGWVYCGMCGRFQSAEDRALKRVNLHTVLVQYLDTHGNHIPPRPGKPDTANVCAECGALVADHMINQHKHWHQRQEAAIEGDDNELG